jgi:hypothetical protein
MTWIDKIFPSSTWTNITKSVSIWSIIPISPRIMVVWDAGLDLPESCTTWDNKLTNWIA